MFLSNRARRLLKAIGYILSQKKKKKKKPSNKHISSREQFAFRLKSPDKTIQLK